jgi:hypothetical protein
VIDVENSSLSTGPELVGWLFYLGVGRMQKKIEQNCSPIIQEESKGVYIS